MCNINVSVTIPTRGRLASLQKAIISLYKLAKEPDKIEILLRIDDDDNKTISFCRTNDLFKKHKNIKVYLGKRLGYDYLWLYFKQMFSKTKGDIIVPFSDDSFITIPNWDEIFYKYKDQVAIIGYQGRIGFTRKAYDKYDCIQNMLWRTRRTDGRLWKWAVRTNIYIPIDNWRFPDRFRHGVVCQNGILHEWRLKDLKLLDEPPVLLEEWSKK